VKFLISLWKFSRPHTIIGSFISISILFLLSISNSFPVNSSDKVTYIFTLASALFCNLFITGLNQVFDLEIDRINKPKLPLVTGELSIFRANQIIIFSLLMSLMLAFIQSWFFGSLITLICFLGWAYSAPPIRFKRHHVWAASAIALVRGPLVNIGIGLHFIDKTNGWYTHLSFWDNLLLHSVSHWNWIVPISVFVTAFSLGIAWFKDLPDTDGDAQHQINTLAVAAGKKRAFYSGFILVSLGYAFLLWYVGSTVMAPLHSLQPFLYLTSLFFAVFLWMGFRVQLNNQQSLKTFYKVYWVLFFGGYLSFLLM
jgi:homogentisate phytyltransferase/homogentisate geranylgeranyltransferase